MDVVIVEPPAAAPDERVSRDVAIGCDVGQKRDPTAIAVVERRWRPNAARPDGQEDHYFTRYLQRLPLNTAYPEVARRILGVVGNVAKISSNPPRLYIDATGVGQPLVDTLHEAGVSQHAHVYPVTFTHGDRLDWEPGGPGMRLGKAYLVARLQVLLDDGRLHLPPDDREARQLAQELKDYEVRIDERANDTYGAFKVGQHDDLVTALGLAVVHRWQKTTSY